MKTIVSTLLALAFLAGVAAAQAPGENAYCAIGDKWIGPSSDGPATLPQTCIYTGLDGTPSPGKVTVVLPGPDPGNGKGSVVTQALQAASCGDTIELVAGQTYTPFVLPAKNCDAAHWITIRTSAPDSALLPEHTRINPSYAGVPSLTDRPPFGGGSGNVMAKIQTPKAAAPITALPGANFYRIGPGIELTRLPGSGRTVYDMAVLMGADHIIFDRDWFHGSEQFEETNTAVLFSGATNIAVINSYANSFKCKAGAGVCTDSHVFSGGDGIQAQAYAEGTWKVVNNFIEAAGENIMFGGGGKGNEVPTDIEIRQNHLYKPPSWRLCSAQCYIAKNLFELKNGSRVLFEGNLLEGSWGGFTQSGFAVVLAPRGSWAHVEDVTLRYNHISHIANGFELCACKVGSQGLNPDSGGARGWSIHDILLDDIQGKNYKGTGNMLSMASDFSVNPPLSDVFLDHLTYVGDQTDEFMFVMGTNSLNPVKQMGPFTYTNSIVHASNGPNIWQIGGTETCVVDWNPVATFNTCFTQSTVANNIIVGWPAMYGGAPPRPTPSWPAGNFTPPDYSTVFVRPAPYGGDYHTLPAYAGIGADIDTINTYMKNVE